MGSVGANADHEIDGSKSRASFNKLNPLALNIDDDDGPINEEDQILQQDVEARKGPRTVRLNFNSDSSDNDERGFAKSKGDNEDNDDDDDDDMFGDSDAEAKPKNEDLEYRKKKKSVQLMDMNAFEKQEGLSGPGPNVDFHDKYEDGAEDSDYSEDDVTESNVDINYFVRPDEDSEEDITNASLSAKKNEPKLEDFSLRPDMEEGRFDVDGNFIRNAADEEAHHDLWLTGVSKKDIARAREAQALREQSKQYTASAKFVPKSDILAELISYLDIGETPIEALQRLGVPKSPNYKHKHSKARRKGMRSEPSEQDKIHESDRKSKVEAITDLADKLSNYGSIEVYDKTREELSREYQRETGQSYMDLKRKRSRSPQADNATDETEPQRSEQPVLVLPDADAKWEYKWEGSDEVHGPYSTSEMTSWAYYNYFDQRVSVREVGKENQGFVNFLSIKFA